MALDVRPIEAHHLEQAAALVSERYRALWEWTPLLPARYADVEILLPRLHEIAQAGPGVVALQDGRLVGFLSGWQIPNWRGKRAAFSPEWGNAALLENSRRIYEEMYTRLAATWVAGGHFVHLMGTFANDARAIAGWNGLGFGMAAADGVRSLEPVREDHPPVTVRRAGLEDVDALLDLNEALRLYLTASPTFLVRDAEDERKEIVTWLQDPDRAMWVACRGAEAVAYMRIGPASRNASTIIYDPGTASITGAFTREEMRGEGVGTALLNRALAWARDAGYERCAVDFEPMNVLAARFWLRYFDPVSYALVRHVDERAI
jgi:GNAT superfamily N-acetyltransferase